MSAHAAPAIVERCACGTAHRTEATWTRCASNRPAPAAKPSAPATDLAPIVVTAEDVTTVLGSKYGALVRCPWGGVMGVAMVYRGHHDVIVTSRDVAHWFHRSGGLIAETARALSADLAWLAQDDLAVAA